MQTQNQFQVELPLDGAIAAQTTLFNFSISFLAGGTMALAVQSTGYFMPFLDGYQPAVQIKRLTIDTLKDKQHHRHGGEPLSNL
jgi:hypothetical protein